MCIQEYFIPSLYLRKSVQQYSIGAKQHVLRLVKVYTMTCVPVLWCQPLHASMSVFMRIIVYFIFWSEYTYKCVFYFTKEHMDQQCSRLLECTTFELYINLEKVRIFWYKTETEALTSRPQFQDKGLLFWSLRCLETKTVLEDYITA